MNATNSQGSNTRRERRRIELEERRADRPERRARQRRAKTPAWRSTIVLLTGGALAVGLVIIALAFFRPGGPPPTDELTAPIAQVPAGLTLDRTLGNPDAPVTVEIWSDFQCPACRQLAVSVEPSIISSFVVPGTARLVYRDAAFQGQRGDPQYDELVEAAAGARCAAGQGRFWQMHDWLFANWDGENEGAFRPERLRSIAGAAGLELPAYDTCMAAGDKQASVRSETQQGLTLGIDSTPTLFVNGLAVAGVPSIAQLSDLIRQAAEASAPNTVVAAGR